MPYKSINDAPPSWRQKRGYPLSLAQVNHLAEIYDSLKKKMDPGAAIGTAWGVWLEKYTINDRGDGWKKKID